MHIFVIAGILQDHVERRERDGVGWPKCFRFVLFLSGKIWQRKTIGLLTLEFQMQDDEVSMEMDTEDQEGGYQSLATRLLPSENKQICSLLVRIEADLSQITENPHKQEDRDIDCSLLQVTPRNLPLWVFVLESLS